MPLHPALPSSRRSRRRLVATAALGAGTALLAAGLPVTGPTAAAPAPPPAAGAAADRGPGAAPYRGEVHVVPGRGGEDRTVDGFVFDDRDRDSVRDPGERGLPGVTVSNGREVTSTDRRGGYRLPARDGMSVFVTQPRGWRVPVDDDNVAQFSYHHLPEGSPPLRYGGQEPTGPLPEEVSFPLTRSPLTQRARQHCVVAADVQTYDEEEVGYARRGAFADLAGRTDYAGCGALFVGDVVGDDLSLYDRTRDLAATLNGPAWFLPGNHDLDFDSPEPAHNFDTFKAQLGPDHYSFDSGTAHVVALNDVEYPTVVPPRKSSYRGAIDREQLEWLRRDIARVPRDRVIVLAAHIPLLEFWYSPTHRVREVREVYEILEGREVVAVSGHTHMQENLREGDLMAGWKDLLGAEGLPFTHLTTGAVSGHWYSGRLLPEGFPTAIQRDGTPPGVLTLDITGKRVTERYAVRGADPAEQMSLGLNSPRYRDWFARQVDAGARTNSRAAAVATDGEARDFRDPLVLSRADLAGTTWLTTNLWNGGTGSTVEVRLDGRAPVRSVRTQQLDGEDLRIGAEWSDPVANQETLVHGGGLVDRSMHLWRHELPAGLAAGEHTAVVTTTDVHGRRSTDRITFEVTR